MVPSAVGVSKEIATSVPATEEVRELQSKSGIPISAVSSIMPAKIEDYALIGDCHSAALVARDGSIDWLCLPRFDSGACFAALLGKPDNGRWRIAPHGSIHSTWRHYREGTLILETEHETDEGRVAVIDFMPLRDGGSPGLIRIVEGRIGQVPCRMELSIRFDYGSIIPWVQRTDDGLSAIAGPDRLLLHSPVEVHGQDFTSVADFSVAAGQRLSFFLSYHPSFEPPPAPPDPEEKLRATESWWRDWSNQCRMAGPYHDAVLRSLITLKALTYAPTGGVVAAATTSLPEQLGGVRNWDYRFCWLRDATFTLLALIHSGFHEEARAWREWLLRAAAGKPSELQIMYGITGERRLTELELNWLPGYEGAKPVRIGNAAHGQFQLDVYGETIDAMYQCRRSGLSPEQPAWHLECSLLHFLESAWDKPDEGIWEIRGPRRHFTHSKVMAWVAFDRAVKVIEQHGHKSRHAAAWKKVRDSIHAEICAKGFDRQRNSFVQYYGSKELDASLLMIPLVGFLPPDDPRVRGTVEAIQHDLMRDGFVQRYNTGSNVDGLPAGEGAFLACTFWLADNLVLLGRRDEAREIFEHLLSLRNDVGLLSEEYDPKARRLVGNFPQAFSHIGLVNTAHNLCGDLGPGEHRSQS
jgi:GH15 family glucan-1,4-alpha-glucosidase